MHGCLFGLTRQTFSTFRAIKIILIENAIKIHLYLFFVGSELVLDVSDPMPARLGTIAKVKNIPKGI